MQHNIQAMVIEPHSGQITVTLYIDQDNAVEFSGDASLIKPITDAIMLGMCIGEINGSNFETEGVMQ
jgi:hypothetical protein